MAIVLNAGQREKVISRLAQAKWQGMSRHALAECPDDTLYRWFVRHRGLTGNAKPEALEGRTVPDGELVVNGGTMSCCGRPRGECSCGGRGTQDATRTHNETPLRSPVYNTGLNDRASIRAHTSGPAGELVAYTRPQPVTNAACCDHPRVRCKKCAAGLMLLDELDEDQLEEFTVRDEDEPTGNTETPLPQPSYFGAQGGGPTLNQEGPLQSPVYEFGPSDADPTANEDGPLTSPVYRWGPLPGRGRQAGQRTLTTNRGTGEAPLPVVTSAHYGW